MSNFNEWSYIQKIILAISIFTIISFLAFPVISYHFDEENISVSETIFEFYGDSPYDRYGFNFGDSQSLFGIIISVIAGVVTIIFTIKKNPNVLIAASVIGAFGLILFIMSVNSQVAEINRLFKGTISFSISDFLGFGVWVNTICFLVNIVLSYKLKKQEQEYIAA